MRVKKVRRMCMVKGCRNIACYTLTAGREFGNSVIMCGDCLRKANEEVEKIENAERAMQNEISDAEHVDTADNEIENAEGVMGEPDTPISQLSQPDADTETIIETEAESEAEANAEAQPVAEPEPAEEKKPSPAKNTATKKTTSKKGTKK